MLEELRQVLDNDSLGATAQCLIPHKARSFRLKCCHKRTKLTRSKISISSFPQPRTAVGVRRNRTQAHEINILEQCLRGLKCQMSTMRLLVVDQLQPVDPRERERESTKLVNPNRSHHTNWAQIKKEGL